jgi:hypothetical protein
MKQPINEIKKMQLLAGLITESEYRESLMNENLESDFNEKALKFLNKYKRIIVNAVKYYNKQDEDEYEDSLIQTIYNFFDEKISDEWPKLISIPTREDEEDYVNGWTDEKDEKFTRILEKFLKTI